MADQIMTVSKTRLAELLGSLTPPDMGSVDRANRIQAALAA